MHCADLEPVWGTNQMDKVGGIRGFSLGFVLREQRGVCTRSQGLDGNTARAQAAFSTRIRTFQSEFQYVHAVYQIQDINLKVL